MDPALWAERFSFRRPSATARGQSKCGCTSDAHIWQASAKRECRRASWRKKMRALVCRVTKGKEPNAFFSPRSWKCICADKTTEALFALIRRNSQRRRDTQENKQFHITNCQEPQVSTFFSVSIENQFKWSPFCLFNHTIKGQWVTAILNYVYINRHLLIKSFSIAINCRCKLAQVCWHRVICWGSFNINLQLILCMW